MKIEEYFVAARVDLSPPSRIINPKFLTLVIPRCISRKPLCSSQNQSAFGAGKACAHLLKWIDPISSHLVYLHSLTAGVSS